MNWSQRNELASRLDALSAGVGCSLVETSVSAVVAQLSAESVRQLIPLAEGAGLKFRLEDATETEIAPSSIHDDIAPYRLTFAKRQSASFVDYLTISCFTGSVRSETHAVIRLARNITPFEALTCRYTHWDDEAAYVPSSPLKSPREIVRESGEPSVASDIGRFILREAGNLPIHDVTFQAWATLAYVEGVRALASEISSDGSLLFRGPTSVRLEATALRSAAWDQDAFKQVQAALKWVFENPKETEMRHGLFSAEIARLSGGRKKAADVIANSATSALESARIALQLGLSELNRDSLKALSDLRKAVSDEAGKIVDSTRSLVGALATAVFAGVGLIAAKLTTSTPTLVLITLAGVLLFYVGGVVWSGYHFIEIQNDLRKEWRSRSYAFLTDPEFEDMVSKPMQKAEKGYRNAVIVSLLATSLLVTGTVLAAVLAGPPPSPAGTIKLPS